MSIVPKFLKSEWTGKPITRFEQAALGVALALMLAAGGAVYFGAGAKDAVALLKSPAGASFTWFEPAVSMGFGLSIAVVGFLLFILFWKRLMAFAPENGEGAAPDSAELPGLDLELTPVRYSDLLKKNPPDMGRLKRAWQSPFSRAVSLYLIASLSGLLLLASIWMTVTFFTVPNYPGSVISIEMIIYLSTGIAGTVLLCCYVMLIRSMFGFLWKQPIPIALEVRAKEE